MYHRSKAAGKLDIRGSRDEIMENPETRNLTLFMENGDTGW